MIPGMMSMLALGGGSGVIAPGAVNWTNITGSGAYTYTGNTQRMSVLTQPISLQISISGYSEAPADDYLNTTIVYIQASVAGVAGDLTECASGVTAEFTVQPDDDVYFLLSGAHTYFAFNGWDFTPTPDPDWQASFTVAIKYKSVDGGSYDTTLDSFDVAIT
jgi:hypothetical protein